MADLSSFSSTNYHVSTWINNALKEKPDDEALESYLAQLAMKLHIISQDYTDQLETGMVEAMSTMPRILSDISRIEESLKGVNTEMESLAVQLRAFDQKNISGVENLSRLDTLKTNMEKCKATLEEHARWSQVVREAKGFLESGGSLTDSADRIETMFRSLDILQNMPGHEERRETCARLSEDLLAAVRPRMRKDVAGLDLSPLHEYLHVYDKLGRKLELEEEYIKARPERLKVAWSTYDGTSDFVKWLQAFLSKVVGLIGDEASHTIALFGKEKSPDIMCGITQEAIRPLAGSWSQRLKDVQTPAARFAAYEVVDHFAAQIIPLLEGCSPQHLFRAMTAVYSGPTEYSQFVAENEGDHLRNFLLHSTEGVTLAASSMASDLASYNDGDPTEGGDLLPDEEDPADVYCRFGERLVATVDVAFGPTEAAMARAGAFVGGLKVKPCLRAIAAALALFAKHLAGKVDELRVACGLPLDRTIGAGAGSSILSAGSVSHPPGSGVAAGMDSEAYAVAQSWALRLQSYDGAGGRSLVPASLRALQAAGRLARRMRELDVVAVDIFAELSLSLMRDTQSQSFDKLIAQALAGTLVGSRTVGAVLACQSLQANSSSFSETKSFLTTATSHHHSTQNVFAPVGVPLGRFKSAAGALLFDLCTFAPEKATVDLCSEAMWSAGALPLGSDADGADVATDENMLPQPAVTQVGEHLLSLVQELETFASSDALVDLLHLSGEAQALALGSRGWRMLKEKLEFREEEGMDHLCRRSSSAAATAAAERLMFGAALSAAEEGDVAALASNVVPIVGVESTLSPDEEEVAATGFVNEWLQAIADAVVGLLLVQIASVQCIGPLGRAQLRVDIDYMRNVFNAMGLRQHPLLGHLRQILLQPPSRLAVAASAMTGRTAAAIALQRFDGKVMIAIQKGHGLLPIQ